MRQGALRFVMCWLCGAACAASLTTADAANPRAQHRRHKIVAPETGIAAHYQQRAEVLAFIDAMADQHGFAASELKQLFARTRYLPAGAGLMTPGSASRPKSWHTYRARFVEPQRIYRGVKFWQDNAGPLQQAARQYGVPEEIIVAIIGVETVYGRTPGRYRVMDALTTLAFDYPPDALDHRAPFFRAQLEDYLLLVRENGIEPLSIRGSYAGAIGMPQFMPGSWRRYAVDFDGDGKIDLRHNSADVIGSVANFLHAHGWMPQLPTHYPVDVSQAKLEPLIEAGITPQFSVQQLAQYGVKISTAPEPKTKLALIDLPNGGAPTAYMVGTLNFFTITRYNRSSFYAMAVIELAQTIREEYQTKNR